MRQTTKNHIDEHLYEGVIEPYASDSASPVFFAPKKDDKIRFFVDNLILNQATIPVSNPLPSLY